MQMHVRSLARTSGRRRMRTAVDACVCVRARARVARTTGKSGDGMDPAAAAQGRPTRRVAGRPGGMGRSKRRGGLLAWPSPRLAGPHAREAIAIGGQ